MKHNSVKGTAVLTLGFGLMLVGCCAVGPNYSRPTMPAQAGWKEPTTTTNAPVLPTEWWRIFNDAELDALEAQAVAANQDLKRAGARVTEARALARVSKAELYPSAGLANERYQRGLSSYLEVVDAQRAALQAERQETQLRGQQAISTILLAKALGGGWEHTQSAQGLVSN